MKSSEVRVETSKLVLPSHADVRNPNLIAAGQLLQWMDITACLSAERHSGYPSVTASMDDLEFYEPVHVGSLLLITAVVTKAFNTSMEVSCKVETEDLKTAGRSKICSTAYFTFVSLDEKSNKISLPPLEPETEEEKREYELAQSRRDVRLRRIDEIKTTADLSHRSSSSSKKKSSGSKESTLEPIKVKDTRLVSTELVFSQHANHHGTLFGGQVLDWMCLAATISASKLRKGYCILKSLDDVHFLKSASVGDRVIIRSQVNNTFLTSLEIGVRVDAYPIGGEPKKINSAFFTFVALDHDGTKIELPEVIPTDDVDIKRFHEAKARRKIRLERRSKRSDQKVLSAVWSEDKKQELICENISNLTIMRGLQWDLVSDIDGVSLYIKDDSEGQTTSIRVECLIEETASKIFKYLASPARRREWDPLFESSKTIQTLDPLNSLIHIKLKKSSENAMPRDFSVLASLRFPMDFSPHYIISLRSVIIDSIPEEEGVERNESKTSGFIITPTGPKCSKVTFFNQMSSTTATHYATEIIGASRMLQQTLLSIREKILFDPRKALIDQQKKVEEEVHYADADICNQS